MNDMDDDVREGKDDDEEEEEEENDSAATIPPEPIQKSPLQYLSKTCNTSDAQETERSEIELPCRGRACVTESVLALGTHCGIHVAYLIVRCKGIDSPI